MNKKFWLLLTAVLSIAAFATGCEEDADNKMAAAQKCLDDLDDNLTNPADDNAALACEAKIAGIETPESYVIRCGLRFYMGGLRTSAILSAFDAYENASTNNKANVLMDALKQGTIAESQTTFDMCERSGVSSLIYISSASLIGTMVSESPLGGNLANCYNGGSGGNCSDAEVGEAVVALSSAYCVGDAKDTQVCSEVASAIAAAGGVNANPADIAVYLYQYLQ